jgi:hypothetical protein
MILRPRPSMHDYRLIIYNGNGQVAGPAMIIAAATDAAAISQAEAIRGTWAADLMDLEGLRVVARLPPAPTADLVYRHGRDTDTNDASPGGESSVNGREPVHAPAGTATLGGAACQFVCTWGIDHLILKQFKICRPPSTQFVRPST